MTADELKRICITAKSGRIDLIIDPLNAAMEEFEVNTPRRAAAFIAQVVHESGAFKYMEEIASGEAYEGRKDLGNVHPGDGKRFKGRGLMQITGRENYQKCGDDLGVDLISNPDLLAKPGYSCRAAGWFWKVKNLNALADDMNFLKISIRINGRNKLGLPNGWLDRQKYFAKAIEVLGVA